MNEELKNKIESAKKEGTYWNDEAMIDDLIKQGYKKEDIDNILKVSVIETIAKKRFKLLLPFFVCPLLGAIIVEVLFAPLTITLIAMLGLAGGTINFSDRLFFLSPMFAGYLIGLVIAFVIYRKRIKKLSFEQLSISKHNAMLIIVTLVITGVLSFVVYISMVNILMSSALFY